MMVVLEHTTLASRLAFGRAFIHAVLRQAANATVARIAQEFMAG